ncbi:MAG: hypothetical protein A2504_16530 [Bdellovibrionales bacterium RIFOXYD12_FULL_39_22]|nr:MAG: hypothetical protein A2385_12810 [Bdellovibrionales bacterium RIFOXYB1_FULL_39_21]OFZ44982.1 MAG: hypothetical protein A2404_14095 [Bdellovibrionales bacterium RIFOXYC1_FULL_39_130]OFZ74324.1 MAG: hypothetical protein A2560_17310 [Bdellovibrionales bacterium RIFOXYD1_FULL_39_84]OFZ94071.1 MAG: hypothetical protein A2504_16530 [Bdellovibrionales bacterium RIFOXYD12_FULL_39_22]
MKKLLVVISALVLSANSFSSQSETYVGENFISSDNIQKCSIKILNSSNKSILVEVNGLTDTARSINLLKEQDNLFFGRETFEDDTYYIGGSINKFKKAVHQVSLELDNNGTPIEFTYERNIFGGGSFIDCKSLELAK